MSRGRLRNNGAKEAIKKFGSKATLLFTDIDVFSTIEFLQRCQSYSIQTHSVYFPVVWSEKMPKNEFNDSLPKVSGFDLGITEHKLNRSLKERGFWRRFGTGMSCMKGSDFQNLGGFPEYLGWGSEDTTLYRNALNSGLSVLRLEDRGLIHKWHPKNCTQEFATKALKSSDLSLDRIRHCKNVNKQHL